jgi:hypothetical protein
VNLEASVDSLGSERGGGSFAGGPVARQQNRYASAPDLTRNFKSDSLVRSRDGATSFDEPCMFISLLCAFLVARPENSEGHTTGNLDALGVDPAVHSSRRISAGIRGGGSGDSLFP